MQMVVELRAQVERTDIAERWIYRGESGLLVSDDVTAWSGGSDATLGSSASNLAGALSSEGHSCLLPCTNVLLGMYYH